MPTPCPAPPLAVEPPVGEPPAAPDPPEPHRRPGRRRRSAVLLTIVLLVVALAGTGCVRVRAGLAVTADDTVSGQIDIATPAGAPGGNGPPLVVPSELSGDVDITRYDQDGYVGSRVTFTDLSFDDVSRILPAISPTTTSSVRLQLRRAGDRVVLSGQVDLTKVSAESSDVQLKIAFPGPVTQTDGTVSQGVVSWTFAPGAVGDVNAVSEYPDPHAPSWVLWVVLLGVLVLAAAGLVIGLAVTGRTRVESRARR